MNIEKFTVDIKHKAFYKCNEQLISVDDVLEIMRNSMFQSGHDGLTINLRYKFEGEIYQTKTIVPIEQIAKYTVIQSVLDCWQSIRRMVHGDINDD